jgi:hypothetical protein
LLIPGSDKEKEFIAYLKKKYENSTSDANISDVERGS